MKNLSTILVDKNNYFISGEINSEVDNKDEVIEKIKSLYIDKGELVEIDGLSIIGDTWWFNIRKSNTEPLLRLNCEADSQEALEKLKADLLNLIRA